MSDPTNIQLGPNLTTLVKNVLVSIMDEIWNLGVISDPVGIESQFHLIAESNFESNRTSAAVDTTLRPRPQNLKPTEFDHAETLLRWDQ